MKIEVTHNIGEGISLLARLKPEFPVALAQALTFTAEAVQGAIKAELRSVFDRPTPYTENSLYKRSATPARLESRVFFKDARAGSGTPAAAYLGPEVAGGPRSTKRFEYSLQAAGAMPKGWRAIPGKAATLDGYGNVSRGQIIQILSQLRITLVSGFTRNISTDRKKKARAIQKAGGQYFAVTQPGGHGKLPPGIYQRSDTTRGPAQRPVKCIFIFVPAARYKVRLPFEAIARRTTEAVFPQKLDAAVRRAAAQAGAKA